MSRINDNNNGNGNGNGNRPPPRRKRRWYSNPAAGAGSTSGSGDKKQKTETPIDRERERIENEKQVLKMEQQLHEYFHKSKTPYSYIDDKGIYNFTPTPAPAPAPVPTPPPQSQPTTTTNPFMNMTFSPFVPSNTVSLFSNGPSPNIWASIFPIAQFQAPQSAAAAAAAAATTYVPSSSSQSIPIVTVDISENIQHIDDIIALCDKYPLVDNTKYNINMTAIHAIREPLTDLSNMVGMTTIKRTIVDQILYYLQDLHIPEPKNNGSNTTNMNHDNDQERTASNNNDLREKLKENVKNIFNPFAPSFPAFQASTVGPSSSSESSSSSSSSSFPPLSFPPPPFNIKKPNSADDFALPTKGDFMHTVIYGPPGSGKTEVAKIIGRIFSNLGILNKKIFKKVSRNDLVAGYLGQTAIKTKDMIKASLGGVLFIDEAYSLGNSEKKDSFAKECVDTLCEALSEHKQNWMVIIAGYEKELNDCFFSLNEGLNSRFTWRFKLDAYKPCELKAIYVKQVRDYGWSIAAKGVDAGAGADAETGADADVLPLSWFESRMDYFTTYGRDMETLFTKTKIAHSRRVFCLPMSEKKIITFADLENGFKLFIENPEVNERKERGGGGPYMKTLYL
jgi:hypothetical protein